MLALVGGAALRISQLGQSLFGDEMWTWVGATDPSFGGMLEWVDGDQEITPPLFTALAWVSVRLGDDRLLLALPALIAGIATIALVYAVARLLFDRRVALIATVLAALSPGLAFFSVEARAYGLAIALVAASTLAMLLASEGGRSRWWWVAYGALSAAAMYTHYTTAFVLLAQLGWLLAFRPAARRPALIANVAAAVAYLPWVGGLLADFDSPAKANHELLAPFGLDNLFSFAGTAAFGHPFASLGRPSIGLNEFLGGWVELALFAGIAIGAGGAAYAWWRGRGEAETAPGGRASRRQAVLLIAALALAAPAGCVLVSLLTDDLYLPRNLITSLPALLIGIAALIAAAPAAPRAIALVLTIGAFGYAAVSMLEPDWRRPDVEAAAALVDREAEPGEPVLDATWFAGGMPEGYVPPPLVLTLDTYLESATATDALAPSDIDEAARAASGGRLWLVGPPALVDVIEAELGAGEPVVREVFDGLFETEVVAIPIPAGER